MSFYKKGQVDIQNFGNQPAAAEDYTATVDTSQILRDPRFLNDLRSYYREKGQYFADDKHLIDMFYSDQNWGDLNTVGAIGDAAEASSASAQQRDRMRRINSVWQQLPSFWQQGGRGVGALGDIAGAIIADPVNLIPGVAAYKGAATAGRAAYVAGKSAPVARGAVSGVGKAAASEAAISAGQEAIVNTAQQVRDIQTGAREGFSGSELGLSALAGGVLGAGVGGAIGVPSGIAGARQGVADIDSLRARGMTDAQIRDTLATGGARGLNNLVTGSRDVDQFAQPAPAEEAAPVAQAEAAPTAQFNTGEFGDFAEDLARVNTTLDGATRAARQLIDDVRRSGADADTIKRAEEEAATIASLRSAQRRAEREAKQIIELENSNAVDDVQKAAQLRRRYEGYMADVRQVLAAADGLTPDELLTRMDADGFGLRQQPNEAPAPEQELAPAPEAPPEQVMSETPSTDGPMETAPQTPEPEPAAEAAPAPAPAPAPEAPATPVAFGRVEGEARALLDDGYTEADLARDIESGLIATGKRGQLIKKSIDDIRTKKGLVQGGRDLKVALGGDAETPAVPTAREELDGILQTIDMSDPMFKDNPLEAFDAIRRRAGEVGAKTDPDELVSLFARENGLDADVPAPSLPDISIEQRGRALAAGLDWRGLTPSAGAQGGRITKGVITKALRGKPEPSDYALTVQRELDEIADLLDSFGEDLTDDQIRTWVAKLGASNEFSSSADDLLALLDHEIRMSAITDSNANSVGKFTQTEVKQIRRLSKKYKSEIEGISDDAARIMAEARVMEMRGNAAKTTERGTQKAIDDKSIYTTAGRAKTGRIQSFLRRGTRISKGSDYTVSSGYQVRPNEFGREAAMIQAKSGKGQDLVPYTTTGAEQVFGPTGMVEVKKGGTAWADGVTGRTFISRDFALKARGDAPSDAQPLAAPKAEKSVDQTLAALLDQYADETDVDALLRELRTRRAAKDKAAAPQAVPAADVKPSPAPFRGDKKLIIRSTDNPDDIRIISRAQIEDGKDIYAIIGQKGGKASDPDNWEVRYAPMDADPKTLMAKKALFDSLPVEEAASGRGARFDAGDATSMGDPLPVEQADLITIEPTAEEVAALKLASGKSYTANVAGMFEMGKPVPFNVLRLITSKLDTSTKWPQFDVQREEIVKTLKTLYAMQRRANPQGYTLGNAERKSVIDSLDGILASYSSEELSTAHRMIRDLGGDPNIAPEIRNKRGRGGGDNYNQTPSGQTYININPDAKKTHPKIATLYHEVAHWAYRNILTPEDRVEFWELMSEYYQKGADGKRRRLDPGSRDDRLPVYEGMPIGDGYQIRTNAGDSPQEFFANQFSVWAMQKHSDVEVRDASFWKRMADYVQAIFDRYFAKETIDPNLEPLFAKILPNRAQEKKFALGVDLRPVTPEGRILQSRSAQLRALERDIDEAFATDSAEGIITTFQELKRFLLSVAVNNKSGVPVEGMGGSGPLLALRTPKGKPNTLLKILNEKFKAIDEILGGKPSELTSVDDAASARRFLEGGDLAGLQAIANPQDVADNLRDFYFNGYAGKWRPANGTPGQISQSAIEKGYTSVKHMIGSIEDAMSSGYQRAERKGTLPAGSKPRDENEPRRNAAGAATPSNTKARAKAARATQTARVEAQATADANTPKQKRQRATGKNKAAVDGSVAASPKQLSMPKLFAAYRKHRGTDYGDQIAIEIASKVKARPLPAEQVPVTNDIFQMSGQELEQALLEAIYEGNKDVTDMALYEMGRRANKKLAMKGKAAHISPIFRDSNIIISREVGDNVGIMSSDGIPPAARASLRENLSFLTHRDAGVQTTLRTMAYRLYNIMGKTTRGSSEQTNALMAGDVARLAGRDDTFAGDGVFGDYKSPDFNDFRKVTRRIASTLNKGNGSPDEAIGDLMQMIVRSGALKPDESEAVVEAYRSLDAGMRKRIEAVIGSKYADRSEYVREQAIANEWFADAVNRYTREAMPRRQILEGVITGDAANIRMRNTLDRAIDRTIEYTAYVVNGQIGRQDVKGRYRRLTLYGDMFVNGESRPMSGSVEGALTHPSYAADYAADAINSASKPRAVNMVNFTKGGFGYDAEAEVPVVFYHGTPKGYVFRRTDDNPNVIFKRSQGGNYGPGYYLTANPHVATEVYSRRPTMEAMFQQAEELNLPPAEKEDLDWDIYDMAQTRREISRLRREYTVIEESVGADPDVTSSTLDAFRSALDEMIANEQAIAESLAARGLKIDPYVMPMLIQLRRPVDFRSDTTYNLNHPTIKAIMGRMNEVGSYNERTFKHLSDVLLDTDVDGTKTYRELVNSIMKSGRNRVAAQEELTGFLDDLGHDGMITTHRNTLSSGEDLMQNADTYRASSVTHTSVILFNPEQAKHVDADYFDVNDEMVYNNTVEKERVIPRGVNGDVTLALMDENIESISDLPVGQFGELLEQEGTNSTLTGAMMSMLRRRDMSVEEEAAVRKSGPFKYFERSSQRMKNMGMNWLGDRYKEHFPDLNQRFAKKIMPVFDRLARLPDSDGVLRGHFRRSTSSIGQDQPKSHSRIVKALRFGEGSRQEKALSADERVIFKQIRANLANERMELIKEGYHVGDRGPNYLPQVWDQKKIAKNRDEFVEKMRRYFMREKLEFGQEFTDEQATAFAQGITLKLLDEADDGIFIPVKGTTKNSTFENVDYSRIIELEKYPDMLKELEPFLESNLEGLLVKYFEGSSRRLTSAKRFGVNSHAVSDYLMVANEGKQGIVDLLTKNKQFEYDITAMNPQGRREVATLVDTIRMPFQGAAGEAAKFADKLIEVATTSGTSGTRQMLMDIATLDASGRVNPVYAKRVDAIVGALADFKGKPGSVDTDEGLRYVEDAMAVLLKKPMRGTNKTAMRVSRGIRMFNNVSLLGFTTLTSIGDLGLPIIRSGSFKSWAAGVRNLKDPHYREMIRNVGVAMENIVHERMVHMYGAPDNKASHAFFNATLLTPWTDMNRMIAGATGYEAFRTMQMKARETFKEGVPYAQQSAQYKTAHRFLKNYGLTEFLPGAKRANEMIDPSVMEEDVLRMAVIKFADDAIFQPNPNDIPLWAQTPIGALVFQLKSFPLMMSRLTGHVLREANRGNLKPLAYLASVGPLFGAATLTAKDIIQQRGGEDERSAEVRKRNLLKALGYDQKVHGNENDFMGWYVESMMVMGGLGLLGDVIHSAVSQVDNGAYGQQRMWSTVLGPSYGLGNATMQVAAGVFDEGDNSNAKERSATREVATRIPVLGGNRRFREGVVDALAGEPESGNTGGWQGSWSKSY